MFEKLGIATCEKFKNLIESEQALPALLKSYGIEATPVVWDDPKVDWKSYDRILIRSVWDYILKLDAFTHWLSYRNDEKIPMWNPYSLLTWNLDKHYLLDLEKKGIAIPPTVIVNQDEPIDLQDLLKKNGWKKAVIKPTIAAGGHFNRIVTGFEGDRLFLGENPSTSLSPFPLSQDLIVQKYMEEITQEGEWSLIFFNGKFSHAVLKRPAKGEFRVQPRFGGTTELETASPELIQQGERIVNVLQPTPLYARVDGIGVNEKLLLMELELLEPDLFLNLDPEAGPRFARAIKEKIS